MLSAVTAIIGCILMNEVAAVTSSSTVAGGDAGTAVTSSSAMTGGDVGAAVTSCGDVWDNILVHIR